MPSIVIIEPNQLLRLGILHLLSKANIAITFADYHYSEIKQITNPEHSDLVIVSVSCTDNVSAIAKDIEQIFSPNAILLLSDTPEVPSSISGASDLIAGCIYRHSAPEVLQASAQLILAGGRCFPNNSWHDKTPQQKSPKKQNECLSYATNSSSQATPPHSNDTLPVANEAEMLGLTPRQYEVLVLLARGYPMKTVGRNLNISVATAKAHTESLYQRLDVKNRNAAVYTAIARGATLGWESISSHH